MITTRILPILAALALFSCKKQTDDFTLAPLTDYYPLQTGKFIVYQGDSTVFVGLDGVKQQRYFQVKDSIEAEVTDNNGKPGFRIRRFIRDSAGTQPWRDNNTFFVVPVNNSIEYVENNLRFIKLRLPITEGFIWRGNSYINYNSNYAGGNEYNFYQLWDYTYAFVGQPYIDNTLNLPETLTVNHVDDLTGSERRYSVEVYAKGIGLVYKDLLYEYTDVNNPPGGFGIRLVMIEHN